MRFVFITGAEGSGTTLLRRLIAAPDGCAAAADTFARGPRDALLAVRRLTDAAQDLWDTAPPLADHRRAVLAWRAAIDDLRTSPATRTITHVVLKRSSPFATPLGGIVWPDLHDLDDLGADARVVLIYREPCAATYSALRRGFDSDLRRLAIRCADALTRLAARIAAMPQADVLVLAYADLCERPQIALRRAAAFCDLPAEPMIAAAYREGLHADADRRYRRELAPADAAWLEAFFDARRRRQWDVLERRSVS